MGFHLHQRTLAKPVVVSGIGIHSGKPVNVAIKPAPINHGIQFRRVDLPDAPTIAAHFNRVVDTSLATVIGYNGFIISTIEHLMAAFAGYAIDNALVEVDAYEMPIMDGSAGQFAEPFDRVGMVAQPAMRHYFVITNPIELSENGKFVGLYPSDGFHLSYQIDYPHPLIGNQRYELQLSDHLFAQEISRARTFGFLHEYEMLKQYGLSRGGSLDNVVVIDEDSVLNPGGLRYADEFVRHKMLDCIGDFALLGMPILGQLKIEKSGHAFNHAFLKQFFAQKRSWNTQPADEILHLYANDLRNVA
jgi:UDP-3-O-[3-hydroxymyristoyl] N-acetylglucosamine deacetylase